MEIKQIIASYVGKKVVLVSPSKNIPMPLKPLILQGLEEDYFWALDSKNLPFYVPYDAIRVLSETVNGVLQIQLQ